MELEMEVFLSGFLALVWFGLGGEEESCIDRGLLVLVQLFSDYGDEFWFDF